MYLDKQVYSIMFFVISLPAWTIRLMERKVPSLCYEMCFCVLFNVYQYVILYFITLVLS